MGANEGHAKKGFALGSSGERPPFDVHGDLWGALSCRDWRSPDMSCRKPRNLRAYVRVDSFLAGPVK
ncbi:hypothetical protein V1284_008007 [Nitrobacteraceae bacterium AZCC 2299]|jgi:hypothetical protein